MPLYEYQCSKCGNTFEVLQKFADAPLTVHESCGGTVQRLISAPSFHLKGTGWYATDYAKASSKTPEAKAESGSDGSADAKPAGDNKGETKTETKTESKPAPTTASKTD